MGNSNRLTSYRDIINTFNAVLEEGGGELVFKNEKNAASWRQRAYHFRRLKGESHYDIIQLHREGCVIRFIVLDTPEALGATFHRPSGEAREVNYMESPTQPKRKASGPLVLDTVKPIPIEDTDFDEDDRALIEQFSQKALKND